MRSISSPLDGFSSPFGARRLGGGAFTPASLFAGGTEGAWYDPSDLSTLFQFSSGTTPVTAAGQPVGLMLDKSGNGNHATQAISAKRPIYTEGSGLSWLAFDGVGDGMATAAIDFTATDEMTVFTGVRKLSNAAEGHILEFSSNFDSNDSTFGIQAPGGISAVADSAYVGISKGTVKSFTGIALSSFPAPISNVVSLLSDISADTITLRVNGTQVSTSALNQGTGNYGNYPLYIGARASSSRFFKGNLYGLIIHGKAASADEIASTEAYMAAKTGVTV